VNPTQADTSEIGRYFHSVRAALADLPTEVRDELLEDLPAHLAEVTDEAGGESLERRLGPPAAYAAELRAAAGLEPPLRGVRSLGSRPAVAKARDLLRRANVVIGPLLGYASVGEFARTLRPGWWVLRGYAVGMFATNLLLSNSGVLPRRDSTLIISLAVLALAIGVSVRIGRLAPGRLIPARPGRLLIYAANAVAALVLVGGAASASRPVDYPPSGSDPYAGITDIYPYDEHGEPLRGVVLYDQNGTPLRIGDPFRCQSYPNNWSDPFRYPLCALGPGVRRPPAGSPSPSGSPSPTATQTPTPTPTQTPS
jgi:hypothetical protein